MTEIESQVKTSAENATQASQLAASARDAAETGSNEMGTMLEAMTGISESSQQIAKIIKVIDDLSSVVVSNRSPSFCLSTRTSGLAFSPLS